MAEKMGMPGMMHARPMGMQRPMGMPQAMGPQGQGMQRPMGPMGGRGMQGQMMGSAGRGPMGPGGGGRGAGMPPAASNPMMEMPSIFGPGDLIGLGGAGMPTLQPEGRLTFTHEN